MSKSKLKIRNSLAPNIPRRKKGKIKNKIKGVRRHFNHTTDIDIRINILIVKWALKSFSFVNFCFLIHVRFLIFDTLKIVIKIQYDESESKYYIYIIFKKLKVTFVIRK